MTKTLLRKERCIFLMEQGVWSQEGGQNCPTQKMGGIRAQGQLPEGGPKGVNPPSTTLVASIQEPKEGGGVPTPQCTCRIWVVYIVLWSMRVCALGVLCVTHLGRCECVLCVLYMCVLPV